ncbi:MAG TPA: FtsX-like permease family protein, partial [Balneolaceae bacterium]|nr:FtsX-like permease family protein [Balneolaceae bacterium]
DMDQFVRQFKAYAAKMHSRQPEDMYMYTAMQEMKSVDAVMGGLSMAVGGIAAISLIVGGIGIMNIMLASIVERYSEIGLRRAVGAEKRDIQLQFLTEALALSIGGGLIGVILGIALSYIIEISAGILTLVTLWSIALSFGVAILIGIIFGYFPAVKAAKKDPVEALHHE